MLNSSFEALEELDKAIKELTKGNDDMDDHKFSEGMDRLIKVRDFVGQLAKQVGNFGLPNHEPK